jgi:hypothetical protein
MLHRASLHVVFHSGLHEDQYLGTEDRFVFGKVGSHPVSVINPKITERIVHCDSLSGFEPMGSHWAESEYLFAAYRTMLKEPDWITAPWIGFLQYDQSTKGTDGRSLTDVLDSMLPSMEDGVISLSPIDMGYEIDGNHIAMDFSDPRKIRGDPRCYFPMVADYNRFHGTKWSYSDVIRNDTIALCSSFVMRKDRFMDMMRFCSYVVSMHDLNLFDPDRKHRFAGGLMERYYGTWIALRQMRLHRFALSGLTRM